MKTNNIKKIVLNLIVNITKSKKINNSTNLFKKNLLDSFLIIKLVLSLEKKFKIKLNINKIQTKDIETINKITNLIKKLEN